MSDDTKVFELCSQRMQRLYPTYKLDNDFRFYPGPKTKTLNFLKMKELLLSTDLSRYAELEQITAGGKCYFLDGKHHMHGDRVAFQYFPRSGGTHMRRYLEQITGIYTGSDMDIQWTFMEAQMGMLGTSITGDSNRVWITNTTAPAMTRNPSTSNAEKMIVISRNPLDVMPSFALLMHTNSYSLQINEEYHTDFPEFW